MEKKVYILFEEGRTRTSGDYSSILDVYDNIDAAKEDFKMLYDTNLDAYNARFGAREYRVEYNEENNRFCIDHNVFDEYVEIKIIEKVLKKS